MRTLLGLVLWLAGCKADLGDRCNPLLFNDECHAAGNHLMCVVPSGCAVAYCCPVDSDGNVTASATPTCQACATDDAGTTD